MTWHNLRSGNRHLVGVMAWAATAVACATTSTPRRLPSEEPPATAAPTERLAFKGPQVPAQRLAGASSLASLCDSLVDGEKLATPGSAVEQEQAREAQQSRRAEALEARYVVDIPASGFVFAGYDAEAGQLRLSDRRFALDEESIIDRPTADDPIGFALGDVAAERLMKLHTDNAVLLRLVFQPQVSQMRPDVCIRRSGGLSIKLGAQVLAAYVLAPSGTVMARFETDQFAQVMAQITPVQNPAVVLGKPISADTTSVPIAWQQAAAQLQAPIASCYHEALARQNTIQGSLVVAISLPNGRAQTPRMEVSTVSDDQLIACVLAEVAKAAWGNPPRPLPSGLSLPMTFGPMPQ